MYAYVGSYGVCMCGCMRMYVHAAVHMCVTVYANIQRI